MISSRFINSLLALVCLVYFLPASALAGGDDWKPIDPADLALLADAAPRPGARGSHETGHDGKSHPASPRPTQPARARRRSEPPSTHSRMIGATHSAHRTAISARAESAIGSLSAREPDAVRNFRWADRRRSWRHPDAG